jgi:hypothetical protein
MSLLNLIRPYKTVDLTGFVRVRAAGHNLGWTRKTLAGQLASLNPSWSLCDETLTLETDGLNATALTEKIDADFHAAMEKGWIPQKPDYPHGDDWLGVGGDRGRNALFIIRRFFLRFIGVPIDSVFINGYENGAMWLAVRGQGVDFAAGTFDPLVGGARQHDQTIDDALQVEGYQEAGLTASHVNDLKPGSTIQLFYRGSNGFFKNESFHIFDFDTKGVFTPHCQEEWEISGFVKMPFDEVLHTLETSPEKFKGQIQPVLIDFLMRSGVVPETYPDYDKIRTALYQQVDFHADDFRALRA